MNAPTVTMQSPKKSRAESSLGRFQNTRAPIDEDQHLLEEPDHRPEIGPARRILHRRPARPDRPGRVVPPADLDRPADLLIQTAHRPDVIRVADVSISPRSADRRSTAAGPPSGDAGRSRRNRPGSPPRPWSRTCIARRSCPSTQRGQHPDRIQDHAEGTGRPDHPLHAATPRRSRGVRPLSGSVAFLTPRGCDCSIQLVHTCTRCLLMVRESLNACVLDRGG